MGTKIQSFTDLIAWKEAHKLVLVIYALTKSFPNWSNDIVPTSSDDITIDNAETLTQNNQVK